MATEPISGDLGGLYHTDSNDATAGAGTLATTGTAVTGSGTAFDTEMPDLETKPTLIIAQLPNGTTEARLVTAVGTATACTIDKAFTQDLPASTTFTFVECVQVPFVIDVTGPDASRNEVDTSHLNTGSFDTFTPGSINPGNVSFPIHFVPENAEHQRLIARFASGVILPYVAFFKSASTPVAIPGLTNGRVYWRGYISANPLTMARNETVKLSLVTRVVGDFASIAGS